MTVRRTIHPGEPGGEGVPCRYCGGSGVSVRRDAADALAALPRDKDSLTTRSIRDRVEAVRRDAADAMQDALG